MVFIKIWVSILSQNSDSLANFEFEKKCAELLEYRCHLNLDAFTDSRTVVRDRWSGTVYIGSLLVHIPSPPSAPGRM